MAAGADEHGVLGDVQLAGCEPVALPYQPYRAQLQPLAMEERPGAGRGGAGPYDAVDAQGGRVPVHLGVLDGDLRSDGDALLGLWARGELAVLDAVHRGGE